MEKYYTHQEIKNQISAIHARRPNEPSNIMTKTNEKFNPFANKSDLIAAEKKAADLLLENSNLKIQLASAKAVASSTASAKPVTAKAEPPTHDHLAVKAHYRSLKGEARFVYFKAHKNTITA